MAAPSTAPAGNCAAVGIITARASTEAPGEGVIGALAAAIQSSSKQTVSRTSVNYPAVLYPYAPSVASGLAAMTADLKAAVAACPQQKIVLLGYSQGVSPSIPKRCKIENRSLTLWKIAQCVGDTLGGGGGGALLDAETPPIDYAAYGSHVAAAIMVRIFRDEFYGKGSMLNVPCCAQMGDPRFITSETAFHVGTCNQNGLFPRLSNQLLTTYNSVLQSYCDIGNCD